MNGGGAAVELLKRAALPGPDKTSVVFVAADAGVGKTELLKHVVREQAEAYLSGSATSLWLYVDAQARRLSALDEALSIELDRIRARFSYDAASPLVRTGAVTLVIDGFDELIGSVGAYDEAFSSLADFIGGLEGGGTLVAAARSAYYEQEFLARVNSGGGRGDSWVLRPLRLKEWQEDQRRDFIHKEVERIGVDGQVDAGIAEKVEELLRREELSGVAGKPFFVSRATRLVLAGAPVGARDSESLLERLIDAYIEREVSKLRSPAKEPLLSPQGFRSLYDEIAVEMWRQESRELSRTTIRELAMLVGDAEGLNEDGAREVSARAPSFAMLREGSLPGSVGWEHDVYYAHFLAAPIFDVMTANSPRRLAQLLRRGRLPEDAAALAGRRAQAHPVQEVVNLLTEAVEVSNIDADRVRRNAGLLGVGVLAGQINASVSLRGLNLGNMSLGDAELRTCRLMNLEFSGTDLVGTRFFDCQVEGSVLFDRVIVDLASTRLEIQGLPVESFLGLGVRGEEDVRWLYSPTEVREALHACGLPAAAPALEVRGVASDVVSLLERLCRIYSRTNVVVEGGDNDLTPITGSPYWAMLRKALIDSGAVVASVRSASGHKVFLERTIKPQEIMAGLDVAASEHLPQAVVRLWSILEEKAPV
ncbi:NACHT domain-containing protein [Kineococcus sp. SYSU DK005]|uniref:hypothetical protein n=1 Tax=Kineococcus sp. SYSU DK005 TaxID=3383126 RepID=UPI003D7E9AC6